MRSSYLALPLVLQLGCLVPGGFGSDRGGSSVAEDEASDATNERPAQLPTTIAKMLPFLVEGNYAGYPTTVAPTQPRGPHGVQGVRGYYHPSVLGPLDDLTLEHPKGAGAVLELYSADGLTRFGWAASVKLGPTSDGGLDWLWMEVLDKDSGPVLVDGGEGLGSCIGCHASGDDYVFGVGP